MLVVVSYDISTIDAAGKRRLRRVAKECSNYGQRVQNSVFHCLLPADEWVLLRTSLLQIIDLEQDSLRFYYLGSRRWKERIEHHGTKVVPHMDEPLIT